jgi:hypothetical protein
VQNDRFNGMFHKLKKSSIQKWGEPYGNIIWCKEFICSRWQNNY